ncbi:hypothetical protein CC2G_003371 [Coprinopsis cinerea AmutBmut pab1-1]|nr:hypothetical protein CC2G_003371 [Coprinopsis cinerea AmutBmut pab1-1]
MNGKPDDDANEISHCLPGIAQKYTRQLKQSLLQLASADPSQTFFLGGLFTGRLWLTWVTPSIRSTMGAQRKCSLCRERGADNSFQVLVLPDIPFMTHGRNRLRMTSVAPVAREW